MDSFLKSGDVPEVKAFDTTTPPETTTTTTTQPKFENPSPFPDEPFVMPTVTQPQQTQRPASRVFDGLLPDEVKLFRDMGNDSYAKLYPAYLELKKLQGRATEVERFAGEHAKLQLERDELAKSKFFEHENAWQLDPQVGELATNVANIGKEINHWTETLALIDQGQPVHPIVLDANGRPTISAEPHQPTPALRAQVYSALVEAHTLKRDLDNKISNVRTNFATNYKGYVGKVNEVNQQWFGKFDAVLAPKRTELLQVLPLASRNRPETQLAVNAMVALQLAVDRIAKLEAATAAHNGNAGARAAQPPIVPGNGVQRTVGDGVTDDIADSVKALKAMISGKALGA